eukprot:CAMPEP_0114522372 /NCGR_PEP_ID=MMETSP0109-20121206/20705_1 /TAXON_ID=29199 /ORGANISM="Chlorarachnion reptans, Strain CCCM449" /LENGTH=311 /DNA_ID=CAMNT_0001703581 /DNA_START=66 /DNA_END=1001 /DNA_ORIENTATION=-
MHPPSPSRTAPARLALLALLAACALTPACADERPGFRLRFSSSAHKMLERIGRAKDGVRDDFVEDLADQLAKVVKVQKERLKISTVFWDTGVVEVAVKDAYNENEKDSTRIVYELNVHRQNLQSELYTQSLTSYIDSKYEVEEMTVKTHASSTDWREGEKSYQSWFQQKHEPEKGSYEHAEPRSVLDAFKLAFGQIWNGEERSYVERDPLVGANNFLLWRVLDSVYRFSVWAWNEYGWLSVLALVSTGLFLWGVAGHFYTPAIEYQADGIAINRYKDDGPGEGSPYKERIKYYTPPRKRDPALDSLRKRIH